MFSDNTSLILHPGATCFTYFSRSGKKLRQLVKFALNQASLERESTISSAGVTNRSQMTVTGSTDKGGPLEKLLLALSLLNTYSDVPNCVRDELNN